MKCSTHPSRQRLALAHLLAGLVVGLAGAAAPQPEEGPPSSELAPVPLYGPAQLGVGGDDFRLRQWDTDPPRPARDDWWSRLGQVTQGRVQIEAGYVFTYDRPAEVDVYEHAVGDVLLRVGLCQRLELRVGWPGWIATSIPGEGSSSQTLDPNVGFMLDLWPQRGWRPQTAVLAAVPITLQGDPFALDSLQPLGQLLYLWQLGDRWSVGGTTGLALFDVEGDRFVELQQTASADCLLTPRLSSFGEWSMLADHGSSDPGSEHMLGGGFSLLISERVQATWRAAVGLNARAPDFLTGIRVAVRF